MVLGWTALGPPEILLSDFQGLSPGLRVEKTAQASGHNLFLFQVPRKSSTMGAQHHLVVISDAALREDSVLGKGGKEEDE